jgi:hypothetical protein
VERTEIVAEGISSKALIAHAAQLILSASVTELSPIWNISDDFLDSRNKLRIPSHKEPRPFLHISSGLIDLYQESRKPSLLDNALLAVAAAIHIGLEVDSDIDEAVRLLLTDPLGKPDARAQILASMSSAG